MKILHVVASINVGTGGPAVSVPALADAEARQGGSVRLLTLDYARHGARTPVRDAQLTTVSVGPVARMTRGVSRAFLASLRAHARDDVSLIHNHGLWMAPNTYARRVAAERGLALVTSPRGMLDRWALRRRGLVKALAWRLYERANLAAAGMLHATSELELAALREAGLRQPAAVIPNGVTLPPALAAAPAARSGSAARQLLFLSRLHPKKGVDGLLRAWGDLGSARAGWQLRIAGPDEGGHRRELEQLARKLGLADVEFCGPLYDDAKWRAYRDADLFVLPSHSENFATVVAEALGMATPVVVTGAVPWAGIREHRCGWMTESGALAATLAQALQAPPAERSAMGRRGADWVRREFGWDAIGARMLAACGWLLAGGSRPGDVHVG